jgi:hypothetical protein
LGKLNLHAIVFLHNGSSIQKAGPVRARVLLEAFLLEGLDGRLYELDGAVFPLHDSVTLAGVTIFLLSKYAFNS